MSPKDNNKKVSAAVRILHQKRDASARATHLMVKNDPLITYEKAFLGQAAVKKFFTATFLERKIMSTKTSFKRIALVAASALAIAGFSAVPANAAAINITSTATGATASTVSTPGASGTAITSTINVVQAAVSTTATHVIGSTYTLTDPNGTDVTASAVFSNVGAAVGGVTPSNTANVYAFSIAVDATAATKAVGSVTFTPTMGGVYLLKYTTVNTTLATDTNTVITAGTAGTYYVSGAGASVSVTGKGTSAATAVTGGIASVKFGTKAHASGDVYNLTSSGVGTIQTVAAGTNTPTVAGIASASDYNAGARVTTSADTNFNDVTATVASSVAGVQTLTWTALSASTGAPTVVATATITWGAAPTAAGTVSAANSTSILSTDILTPFVGTTDEVISAINTANARAATIRVVLNDTQATPAVIATKAVTATITGSGLLGGSIGTGTTLAYTDATVTGTIGRSITVNTDALGQAFFGVFADGSSGTGTITITQGTTVVSTEKVTFYGAVASIKATVKKNVLEGATTTGALDVIAYDANSVVVPSVGITVTSGTTATIASFTETTSSAAEVVAGTAVVDVTGVATKFGPVVLTIKDTATGLISTTATVNVGAAEAATVTATLDAASYAAGDKVTLTLTALDANGAPVGDFAGTANSLSITTNGAVQGTMPTSAVFALGKFVTTFYAPLVAANLTVNVKLATGAAWATALDDTTIVASATIEGDSTASLALDAANAATDAANNAYDEAQNATQAASDALAAVTALAAQVKSLIASVKKLTAAVAKLKK